MDGFTDFGSSERAMERERKERQEAARKKRAKERAAVERAKATAARLDEVNARRKAEEAVKREQEALAIVEENRRTGGIKYCEMLRPTATSTFGDRITLPVSALETLTNLGAIDKGPMSFELCAMDGSVVVSSTHAGVAEFVAAEGTVGIPPKTALSLTREKGAAALSGMQIRVKYVRLGNYPKSFVRLQPRGEGFHKNGEDVVNIDIKSVLEVMWCGVVMLWTLTLRASLTLQHHTTSHHITPHHTVPACLPD